MNAGFAAMMHTVPNWDLECYTFIWHSDGQCLARIGTEWPVPGQCQPKCGTAVPSARPVPPFLRHCSAQCQFFGRRRSFFEGGEGGSCTEKLYLMESRLVMASDRLLDEFWSEFTAI